MSWMDQEIRFQGERAGQVMEMAGAVAVLASAFVELSVWGAVAVLGVLLMVFGFALEWRARSRNRGGGGLE